MKCKADYYNDKNEATFIMLAFNIKVKLEMFKNYPFLFKFKKLAFNIKAKLEIFLKNFFSVKPLK